MRKSRNLAQIYQNRLFKAKFPIKTPINFDPSKYVIHPAYKLILSLHADHKKAYDELYSIASQNDVFLIKFTFQRVI